MKSGFIQLFFLISVGVCAFEPANLHQLGGTQGIAIASGLNVCGINDVIEGRNLEFYTGYFRQYELPDLDTRFLGVDGNTGSYSFGLGMSQLGNSDYYSEQTAQVGGGRRMGRFHVAVSVSYSSKNFGKAYSSIDAFAYGLGFAWISDQVSCLLVADNLNRPELYRDSERIERTASLYALIRTSKTSDFVFEQKFEFGQKPVYKLIQRLNVSSHGSLFWDFSANPSTYGGGVELKFRGYSIIYAASIHPILGLSHGLSIAYNILANTEGRIE